MAAVISRLDQSLYRETGEMPFGTQGLYVERQVTNRSAVAQIVEECGLDVIDPETFQELHCTVMFSPDVGTPGRSVPANEMPIKAVAKQFSHWIGHTGKGFLVLEIHSELLQLTHAYWKKMGCVPTFPQYRPHVTLLAPAEDDPARLLRANRLLNEFFPAFPVKLGPELLRSAE